MKIYFVIPVPITGWQIQVHPWQTLRRWLFTRCCRCGQRFPWGASVCTGSWDSPPVPWFGSEIGVYHSNCDDHHDLGYATESREPNAPPPHDAAPA